MENSECSSTSNYVLCDANDLDLYAEIVLSEEADDCGKKSIPHSLEVTENPTEEDVKEKQGLLTWHNELQSVVQNIKEENEEELNLEYDINAPKKDCKRRSKIQLGAVVKKLRDKKNQEKCRNFCASASEMESVQNLEDENLELNLKYDINASVKDRREGSKSNLGAVIKKLRDRKNEEKCRRFAASTHEMESAQNLEDENLELNIKYDANALEEESDTEERTSKFRIMKHDDNPGDFVDSSSSSDRGEGSKSNLGSVIKKLRDRKSEEKCRRFAASTHVMESAQNLENENLELNIKYDANASEEESDTEERTSKFGVLKQDDNLGDFIENSSSLELHQKHMHDHGYAKNIEKSDNLTSKACGSASSTNYIVMTANILNQNSYEYLFSVLFNSKWRNYSSHNENSNGKFRYFFNDYEQTELQISLFFPLFSFYSSKCIRKNKLRFFEEGKQEMLLQSDDQCATCYKSIPTLSKKNSHRVLKNVKEFKLLLSQSDTQGLDNVNLNYKTLLQNSLSSTKSSNSLNFICGKTLKPKEFCDKTNRNGKFDYFYDGNNSDETFSTTLKSFLEDTSENSGFVLSNLPTFVDDVTSNRRLIPDVCVNNAFKYKERLENTHSNSDDSFCLSFGSESESDLVKCYSLISNEDSKDEHLKTNVIHYLPRDTEKYYDLQNRNMGAKLFDSRLTPTYYKFVNTDSVLNAREFSRNLESLKKDSDFSAKEMNIFETWTKNLSNPSLGTATPDFNPTFVEQSDSIITDFESDDYCSCSDLEESIIYNKFHDASTPCKISSAKTSKLKLEDHQASMNNDSANSSEGTNDVWGCLSCSKSDEQVIFTKSISEISSVISRVENSSGNSEFRK